MTLKTSLAAIAIVACFACPAFAKTMVMASDIAVAHTPPGGYGKTFPAPVLSTCTEPLSAGAPDLRGIWKVLRAERGGKPAPDGDTIYQYVERIEQCGDRIVDMGGGTIADARADGTAAVPQSAMIDGWMGDDWFHYGAFRARNVDWFTSQMTSKGAGTNVPRQTLDDYENFLRAGSFGDFAKAAGLEQMPAYRKITEHPAYDAFWQGQALDRILAQQPLKVPTLWMGALWDQEDMWGAIHAYQAVEPKDTTNTMNFLALGPWRHSGTNYEQRELGQLKLPGDTSTEFRLTVLKPFLDSHLKTGAPKAGIAPVTIFETGTMRGAVTQSGPWPVRPAVRPSRSRST